MVSDGKGAAFTGRRIVVQYNARASIYGVEVPSTRYRVKDTARARTFFRNSCARRFRRFQLN